MKRVFYPILILSFLFVLPVSAQIKYDDFFSDEHGIGGMDGNINTIFQSSSGEIYIGGDFKWFNGSVELNGIAKYDSLKKMWLPVGEGFKFDVQTITEYDGEIYAGLTPNGYYNDDEFLYRYDETEKVWHSLNKNISSSVHQLEVKDNQLFASGAFTGGIAKYDFGTDTWSIIDSTLIPQFNTIWSFTDFDSTIVIAGTLHFSPGNTADIHVGAAYLDTTDHTFKRLGYNLNGSLSPDLMVYKGELFIAGWLNEMDLNGSSNDRYAVAKWLKDEEKWFFYEELRSDPEKEPYSGYELEIFNDQLILAGEFDYIGEDIANGLAYLDTTSKTWKPLDVGIEGQNIIRSLFAKGEELLLGGEYISDQNKKLREVFKFSGTNFVPISLVDGLKLGGVAEGIYGLGVFNDTLLLVEDGNMISKWDKKDRIVSNFLEARFDGSIFAMQEYEGKLFVGGNFNHLNNDQIAYLAYLDENNIWHQAGEGLNNRVEAIQVYKDELVFGGKFNGLSFEDGDLEYVGKYDFVLDSFKPLSDGLSSEVYSLFEFDKELYAGGRIPIFWNSPSSGVIKWDTTNNSWMDIDGGINIFVHDMAEHNGKLVVGGNAVWKENQKFLNSTASYNKEEREWEILGSNMGFGVVTALQEYNGKLYAGGNFFLTNDPENYFFVVLDDETNTWQPVDSGIDNAVLDMTVYDNKLFIGGTFQTAGGKAASRITSFTDPMLVSNEVLQTPASFQLYQNYPNPFNPSTNINFNLPEAGLVKLEVFDVLGRKIAELVNEQLNSGNHSFVFEAGNLASGIYVYRLEANNQVLTKKMMLIK